MTDVQVRIVEDGVVVNTTIADESFAATMADQGWVISDEGKRGDVWDGEAFTTPEPEPEVLTLPEARNRMVQWIDGLTSQITLKYPESVQKRWLIEEAAARAVDAGTADTAQTEMITREGAAKGRTPAAHAKAVIVNADKFRAIADQTNTLFLATIKAMEDADDDAQNMPIITAAIASAKPLAEDYGLVI